MSFGEVFPGFRLRLTRWGGLFLLAVLVLGFAAVNTGNNALMALLGLALGSYVVSGAWSRQVLARMTARAVLPTEIYAGRATLVELELENGSRVLPAYGLAVRDAARRELVQEALLAPTERRRHGFVVELPRRGWTRLGPWHLEVLLPLGFFLKTKELLPEERVLVFPKLLSAAEVPAQRGGGRRLSDALGGRGREGEVLQLRDFRDGDDRRQLHWKQTARQQRMIVVDRQRRVERPSFLVLDPRVDDPDDEATRERFEHIVSIVATSAVLRLERGESVGLVVGAEVVPPVCGLHRAATLLRPLAEVEPQSADGPGPRPVADHSTEWWAVETDR